MDETKIFINLVVIIIAVAIYYFLQFCICKPYLDEDDATVVENTSKYSLNRLEKIKYFFFVFKHIKFINKMIYFFI